MLRTGRPAAALTALVAVAALAVGAMQLDRLGLGFTEVTGLPADTPPRAAYDALVQGFAPGMLSPARVVVWGRGVGCSGPRWLGCRPNWLASRGSASVIGPARPAGVGSRPAWCSAATAPGSSSCWPAILSDRPASRMSAA